MNRQEDEPCPLAFNPSQSLIVIRLCYGYFFAEVDVLNGVQQLDSFIHRPLESFASRNETHAATALIDHGSAHGFSKIACSFGLTPRIDQAATTHIAIGYLI